MPKFTVSRSETRQRILSVEGILVDIRRGERSVGAGAGKCLREAERPVRREIGIAVEGVDPLKLPGKKLSMCWKFMSSPALKVWRPCT